MAFALHSAIGIQSKSDQNIAQPAHSVPNSAPDCPCHREERLKGRRHHNKVGSTDSPLVQTFRRTNTAIRKADGASSLETIIVAPERFAAFARCGSAGGMNAMNTDAIRSAGT